MNIKDLVEFGGHRFRVARVVAITIVPPSEEPGWEVEDSLFETISRIATQIGPSCRIGKRQWLVITDEPCGAIWQDLEVTTDCNILVFAFLPDVDFKFSCNSRSAIEEWDFDGIAAFFQGNPALE